MGKTKTHDEYVRELSEKNPNVKVIEKYIGVNIPIKHYCTKHNIYWNISPHNALCGRGCKECGKESWASIRRKTHSTYVEELKINNSTVEVVGQYVNSHTPILHHCLIHDVFWKTTPARALAGVGCEECRKEKFRQVRCKTHEQYVSEVEEVNPDVVVVGRYMDAKTPIEYYCKKHHIFWTTYPDNILKSCGCEECGKEKIGNKNRKTHDEYLKELNEINPNIEVVEYYNGTNTPILHRCKIDNYKWTAAPANILSGKGCPKCAGNLMLTHEEYVARLKMINPHIVPVEKYINSSTPILHVCLIDGYTWNTQPSSTLQGYGCPKCAGNAKKTHDEYVQELFELNPDIEVLEQYDGAKTSILHRCKIDGHEWYASPSNILFGNGCPQCQESKGERQVRQWLEDNNIIYTYQKTFKNCKDIKVLPFDFYIPKYHACIESDGKQHFEPVDFAGRGEEWALQQFEKTQYHDKIKNQYCKNNNITLLRIPYFKNVEEELETFFYSFNIVI